MLAATTSLVFLVPAAYAAAACPSRPLPPCKPTAFTGSASTLAPPPCVPKPRPSCRDRRGPRGPQGTAGKPGAVGATGLQGLQGVVGEAGAAGSPGPAGAPGVTGTAGSTGAQGLQGVQGSTGAAGTQGSTGAAGPDGSAGAIGPPGATGAAGAAGAQGIVGADGTDGTDGGAGATGQTGAAGPARVAEYAYVYNDTAETVAIGSDVLFDKNGVKTTGITHANNTAGITVATAGDYKVTFSVSGTEPSQMALFVNGFAVSSAIYGSGAGTQQNTGQAIVAIASGDVLTVRNHTSSSAVTLQTLAGGTRTTTNASVVIEKLG